MALVSSYKKQINSYFDLDRLRGLNAAIVVDPMHGSGGRWVESFLSGGKLQVETIRGNAIRFSAASIPNRSTAILEL